MKNLLIVICFGFAFGIRAQSFRDTSSSREIGVDGFFNVSTFGGSFGMGLKYGIVKNARVVFGPSLRLFRTWSKNQGNTYSFNIYGGGAFLHYRLQNAFFAGVEFEMLRSPINYAYIASTTHWVPTCFVGGGFSHAFQPSGIRINGGVFYDILNNVNSPFRNSYVLKKENGVLVPVIYRIGFFFPLG